MDQSSNIISRPYTQGELAALYGISSRTLKRWLAPFANEIGPRLGHYYRATQVAVIFRQLGRP